MLDAKLDTSGLDRALQEAARELDGAVADGIEAGLAPIVENARASSSFRDQTGKLRASIKPADEVVSRPYGASGFVVADAGHAKFIEGGTKFASPRPFLGPALEQELDRANAAMLVHLERMLKRAGF